MHEQRIHRVSGRLLIGLPVLALLMVVIGSFQPPQPDEGAAARIFQLSIVALVPTLLLFLTTADWRQPLRSVRTLAFSGATAVLAVAALHYLEHCR